MTESSRNGENQKIKTCLWFEGDAEEAVEFYTSLFPGARTLEVQRYPEAGPGETGSVMTIVFELEGRQFIALNGGKVPFRFNESVSLSVERDTQEEIDRLWASLTEGGEEVECGWLKDRYGLSWQIVPRVLQELLRDADQQRVERAMQAMLGMRRLDIAQLEEAAAG
ncbi:VOC family protein [Streptomyces xiaopingdaonensis]|uniref:VOC family protein n=1 Tax=Streptomyces xiaopingdaonensis TaxID=1565415 RepID=UPI0002E7A873|nr:VOC family protein [Streptomyces xiaopingdaonensis]